MKHLPFFLVLTVFVSFSAKAQIKITHDNQFAGTGFHINNVSLHSNDLYKIVLQPEERVILGIGDAKGTINNVFIHKTDERGITDFSFGEKGNLFLDRGEIEEVHSAIATNDGGILLHFSSRTDQWTNYSSYIVKIDYTKGTLDPSFGDQGQLSIGGVFGTQSKLIDAGNGSFYLVGSYALESDQSWFYTVRKIKADGSPDKQYGTQGTIHFQATDSNSFHFSDAALQSDSKLLVFGHTYLNKSKDFQYRVIRLLPNGNLDTAFGNKGWQTMSAGGHFNSATKVLVDKQDRIYLTGSSSFQNDIYFSMGRLLSDGKIDSSFAKNGIEVYPHSSLKSHICATAIWLNDTSILLGGHVAADTKDDFELLLVGRSGEKNIHFGDSGFYWFREKEKHYDEGIKDMLFSNGELLIAGFTSDGVLSPKSSIMTKLKIDIPATRIQKTTIQSFAPLVYPNPVVKNESIVIKPDENKPIYSVSLTDFQGKVVLQQNLDPFRNGTYHLPIPEYLQSGIYWLKLEGDMAFYARKLVVLD